jgi:hypothetical protein
MTTAPTTNCGPSAASGAWTGSDAQLRTKVPGLVHLIVGSGEYVFI